MKYQVMELENKHILAFLTLKLTKIHGKNITNKFTLGIKKLLLIFVYIYIKYTILLILKKRIKGYSQLKLYPTFEKQTI